MYKSFEYQIVLAILLALERKFNDASLEKKRNSYLKVQSFEQTGPTPLNFAVYDLDEDNFALPGRFAVVVAELYLQTDKECFPLYTFRMGLEKCLIDSKYDFVEKANKKYFDLTVLKVVNSTFLKGNTLWKKVLSEFIKIVKFCDSNDILLVGEVKIPRG